MVRYFSKYLLTRAGAWRIVGAWIVRRLSNYLFIMGDCTVGAGLCSARQDAVDFFGNLR